MSLFSRQRHTESSYECWRDTFEPYLSGLYELMGRRLRSGGVLSLKYRVSYDMFCSFVYQFSSKEIPDIFFKELDERLSREIEIIHKETLQIKNQTQNSP